MRLAIICAVLTAGVWAAESNLERAQSLYSHTDYAGAVRLLNEASRDPNELRLLGQCRFMLNDLRHAGDVLEKAAAFAPNDAMIQLWLGRVQGRRAETAFAMRGLSLAGQTREAFEKAVKLDPKNREALNDLFDFYLEAPGIVGGGVDKARALLPVLDKVDPVEAWHARARLEEQAKHYDSAEADLRHAVAMEPSNTGQIVNLARFLARRRRYPESDEWFDRATRIEPNSPRVLYAKAETWLQSNRRRNEARALLKQYLAGGNLTPDDAARAEAAKLLSKAEAGGS